MNKITKWIQPMITGFGFGSFFLLAVVLGQENSYLITRFDFLTVLFASALFGLYSKVFKSEKISYLLAFGIHFILTFITATIMIALIMDIDSWLIFLHFLLIFVIIYAVVWLVLLLFDRREIKQVNRKLKSRH
ncbi:MULTISPECIES: DUF3021 domain-containing protein [unclassified Enterococcus]|uniref:DUF3021 domain-containing protein n=1 Tax=unclassified Enterococcus TaxID=2608891 RepID=UPI001556FF49|nr:MULTISPECIES: DUF3021 domain-containing protein [unclassified Enterococcus]MBS7576912.1 DUF3021 domain-containing protein [Enterococcus sp. MMGLQ5-2]MBS7584319.1 DUF3021 domain-containing protein [Enterococcus sp. MMGLQ5-1]NPD12175.1 DUF3021 domain-containing protein [Enterococcus sp. MMGLQ5-1]NPD36747.1 DUF3021 domain-containing protein [Enterococcus sp. MMGLQ5-2]